MVLSRGLVGCLVAILASGAVASDLPAPLTDDDFHAINPLAAKLGQALFYDPILSGNRNISCASCHHPRFSTSDGVSLSLGEGGIGLGPDRYADPENLPERRIPRNAPALFNLGAKEITVLFHDGRIEVDLSRKAGFRTPLEDDMAEGFSGILSAQTMFPVLSSDEMAGHYSENDVAQAVRRGRITGPDGAWDIIAKRVAEIPAYQNGFSAAYPHISADAPIAFTDISNAIADFMALEWRSDQSPFDAHLKQETLLAGQAAVGMGLFYGKAGCSTCHSGPLLSDHGFHAMGQPQLGQGKTGRFERHARDDGRQRVTGREEDRFAFRTPSLRNVTRTGPWGHAGAFSDLTAFLQTHTTPKAAIPKYDRSQAVLAELSGVEDWQILDDPVETRAIIDMAAPDVAALTPDQISALIEFLNSLNDPVALSGRLGIPDTVPSGLPLDE